MSSQVKKFGHYQLRDKKPPVLFNCFIANDSVIVHHVKIEIDVSEDFIHKLFVYNLWNLIHG
jgi:hypothetical protein